MRCLRILLDRVPIFVKIKISVPCGVGVEEAVMVLFSESRRSGSGTIKSRDQTRGFFTDFYMACACGIWIRYVLPSISNK